MMDLRLSVPVLVIILLAKCENSIAENATADSSTIKVDHATEPTTTTITSICTVCSCTDGYIDCNNRSLETHFEEERWLNITAKFKVISFERNRLVHVTPFPRIVVERLILRRNRIARIDNRAFKELVNLTELDLSDNQLTSQMLQPHIFEGMFSSEAYEPLSNLQILNLGNNALHWLHQSIFEHIADLKVLNLSGNPFGVFDYRTSIAISSLSYLVELDISYCELRELPNTQFHNAKHLKKLNLTNNQLRLLPKSLEEAETLEYLSLDGNPIHAFDRSNAFPNLKTLRELSLRGMLNLTVIGNGGLSALTGLENLYIQNCWKLGRIEEYAIALTTTEGTMWPPLKKLNMASNALRYLPMLLVGRWDKLEELRLTGNQWNCDCDNQYLIGTVLPEYGEALMGDNEVDELTCSAPPEHEGKKLASLADRHLRCLDLYNARPEKDAAVLVGVLIGLLIAIPIGMAFFVFWRRGFFFCGSQGPGSFSRAFYKRASNDDDI
ncbi:PREDICTED: leucine-rich repeat neuronal protein 2-like isoform X2 [Trachymyrmex cornetzi]|uniref:Leucine-rich repeat neuronal protein 2 n=1 Tax=Trachymyrmex cornetzi TaxID=471704 RepID=A0A195E2E8_9HYME|nr:PREDICTED: leucine-rich repeat neuronal protein 2-like isoform X2 [Trachymyrmex cornetzi]KYN19251.1 Leucine-rich repeat neuronal protein 2 [Trachymyrmex cornetzi]